MNEKGAWDGQTRMSEKIVVSVIKPKIKMFI